MFDNRLGFPLVDPFFLREEIINDNVDLGKGLLLNLGTLFVRRTVLDVVHVVLVSLHAYLAVGVLLIWNWLKQS